MTDLQWTREKPAATGWYWMRADKFSQPQMVEIIYPIASGGGVFAMRYNGRQEPLASLDSRCVEFAGPLTPPAEPPQPTHDFMVGDLVVSRNGGQVMRVIDSRRGGVRCIWPIPSDAEVWERDDHYYAPEFLVLLARPESGIPH